MIKLFSKIPYYGNPGEGQRLSRASSWASVQKYVRGTRRHFGRRRSLGRRLAGTQGRLGPGSHLLNKIDFKIAQAVPEGPPGSPGDLQDILPTHATVRKSLCFDFGISFKPSFSLGAIDDFLCFWIITPIFGLLPTPSDYYTNFWITCSLLFWITYLRSA